MRWQCCDKFTAQSYQQDLRTWKAQMPGRWCVRHSSNRYTANHVLRAEIPVSSVPTPKLLRNLDARPRLLISVVISALVFILLPKWMRWTAGFIITWDSGVICFLALAWSMMSSATPQKMRRSARAQDEGRLAILTLLIATDCTSLLAIGFMLKDNKGLPTAILTLHVMLSGVTVICSWLLMHTMFALHYAHYYYRDYSETTSEGKTGGLDFPSENQPDYWDFLYFSFVISMTCQVSDVQITSRPIRRLALVHGILTFFSIQ